MAVVSLHSVLTDGLVDPVGEVLLQREQLARLRVQNLLPVEVLVLGAGRLRRQRAVGALEAAAHLPVHHDVAVADVTLFLFLPSFEGVSYVLEGVRPLKGIKYSVEVSAQWSVEALGLHGGGRGDGPPGRAAADGGRPAAVVRHAQASPCDNRTDC